jgi:hypothetical protein
MVAVTDLQSPQVWQTVPLTGTFPNYDAVVPRWDKAKSRICLNADYLAQIAKFAAQFNDRSHAVVISFYGEENAIRFDAGDGDGQGMTAVCMPMRGTDQPANTYGYRAPISEKAMAAMHVEAIEEDIQRAKDAIAATLALAQSMVPNAPPPAIMALAESLAEPEVWAEVSQEVADAFQIPPEIATIRKGDAASF